MSSSPKSRESGPRAGSREGRRGAGPFDLHPDGERFAVIQSPQAAETEQSKVAFILHFFDYLRQIAPPRR